MRSPGGRLIVAAVALAGLAGCERGHAAPAAARHLGVEVVVGDTGPRPVDQHAHAEPARATLVAGQQHEHGGAPSALPASAALRRELGAARRRAASLMGVTRLNQAGYYVSSYYTAGVGSHYINWALVDLPFTPETPTMLLLDTTPGHVPRLAGFVYWIRSPVPPPGFTGDADVWHSHRGLCFRDDVLAQEDVPSPEQCAGTWIDGSDLWMLHAWVVPGYENPDGVFAPTNPKLCPPRRGNDALSC